MIELYNDTDGKYRWRAKAPNGQIVATSHQGYRSRKALEKGLAATAKAFGNGHMRKADIRDHTE